MRKKMIAGNWKMNKTVNETKNFLEMFLPELVSDLVDVVIFPSFLSIPSALEIAKDKIFIGAQNLHFAIQGAFTGEVSPVMLFDVGVKYVLIGHSERRELFFETDGMINKKILSSLSYNLYPILCVGENLAEREKGITMDIIKSQLAKALKNVSPESMNKITIAYEPVWAIGTGKTATSSQAEEVCKEIRTYISTLYNEQISEHIRILYGGSVNPTNAKELFSMENIDGGLVGGASLSEDFIKIIHYNQ